jgi:hypothetical protein
VGRSVAAGCSGVGRGRRRQHEVARSNVEAGGDVGQVPGRLVHPLRSRRDERVTRVGSAADGNAERARLLLGGREGTRGSSGRSGDPPTTDHRCGPMTFQAMAGDYGQLNKVEPATGIELAWPAWKKDRRRAGASSLCSRSCPRRPPPTPLGRALSHASRTRRSRWPLVAGPLPAGP